MWQPNGLAVHRLSPTPSQTSNEGRSVDFFRTKVAMKLGGFFDSSFWSRDVLQAAHDEPSIRHAVVALASLSETMLRSNRECQYENENNWENEDGKERPLSRSRSPAPGTFAVRQHAKAVSTLQKSMQDGRRSSPAIVLITCALFICFEMFQNSYEAALRQMSSGVFVFCDWYSKQRIAAGTASPQPADLAYQLEKIFQGLILQIILFIDTNIQDWQFLVPAFTPAMPSMPSVFKSIDEARDCLNACRCSVYHGTMTSHFQGLEEQAVGNGKSEDDVHSPEPCQVGEGPIREWALAFEAFMRNPKNILSPGEQRAAILLEIQHIVGSIHAGVGIFRQETIFDLFEPSFSQIVSLASRLVRGTGESPQDLEPTFPAFDMGILPPLYFVASRCRDPSIRRQALLLLRQGPSQEGIWHRGMLSNIAERIMNLEEADCVYGFAGSSVDISASARISVLNAKIDSARRTVALHCCRAQSLEMGRTHVLHETVTY
jgi:hypothetical protein